jgi:ATP-dependent DNA ligase
MHEYRDGFHRRRCPICLNLARAATLAPGNVSIKERSMKKEYQPMLATLVDQPFDSKDWVYETKWDGFRLVAEVRRDSVRLFSRNH